MIVWLAWLAAIVSLSASVLLPGLRSKMPLGAVTVAVFVTVPLGAVTVAVTLISKVSPAASVGSAKGPCSSWYTLGMYPLVHRPGVAEQVTRVLVSPGTAGSLRIAPVTLLGPLFVTVMM